MSLILAIGQGERTDLVRPAAIPLGNEWTSDVTWPNSIHANAIEMDAAGNTYVAAVARTTSDAGRVLMK